MPHIDAAFEREHGFCRTQCDECERLDAEDLETQRTKAQVAALIEEAIAEARVGKDNGCG